MRFPCRAAQRSALAYPQRLLGGEIALPNVKFNFNFNFSSFAPFPSLCRVISCQEGCVTVMQRRFDYCLTVIKRRLNYCLTEKKKTTVIAAIGIEENRRGDCPSSSRGIFNSLLAADLLVSAPGQGTTSGPSTETSVTLSTGPGDLSGART